MNEKINEICNLIQPKHVKIWRLHLLNISNKEIAEVVKTNRGHVYNVIKDYNNNPIKQSDIENLGI
jgi:predicted DNA-binding protein YlxM (UPF0122 family)